MRTRATAGLLLFVAGRGLLASRLTTALLIAAVAAGVGFQIPNTANLLGYRGELIRQGVSSGFGDVRLRPRKGERFPDGEAIAARARAVPGVIAAFPLLTLPGAAVRGDETMVTPVHGIDPAEGSRPFRVTEGAPPRPGDDDGVLLGTAIARRLHVGVGDSVDIRFIVAASPGERTKDLLRDACMLGVMDCSRPGAGISVHDRPMIVRGLCTGTFSAYEALYVNRDLLAREAGAPGAATMVSVYATDHERAGELAATLATALPEARALGWRDDSQYLRGTVDSVAAISRISYAMVVSAVTIPVWALLYINVLSRQREVGLLGALGFRREEVFLVFLAQALLVGVLGVLAGSGLSYLLIRFFQEHPVFESEEFVIRPLLDPANFVAPALLVLLTTVLAGVIPAVRASRIDPGRILRGIT